MEIWVGCSLNFQTIISLKMRFKQWRQEDIRVGTLIDEIHKIFSPMASSSKIKGKGFLKDSLSM